MRKNAGRILILPNPVYTGLTQPGALTAFARQVVDQAVVVARKNADHFVPKVRSWELNAAPASLYAMYAKIFAEPVVEKPMVQGRLTADACARLFEADLTTGVFTELVRKVVDPQVLDGAISRSKALLSYYVEAVKARFPVDAPDGISLWEEAPRFEGDAPSIGFFREDCPSAECNALYIAAINKIALLKKFIKYLNSIKSKVLREVHKYVVILFRIITHYARRVVDNDHLAPRNSFEIGPVFRGRSHFHSHCGSIHRGILPWQNTVSTKPSSRPNRSPILPLPLPILWWKMNCNVVGQSA